MKKSDKGLEKITEKTDRSEGRVSRELDESVAHYKEDKTAKNRDVLEGKIHEFAQYPKLNNVNLIPLLFEANKALPVSKKFPMYLLFSPVINKGIYFIPKQMVKKPAWDYIPQNLIQTLKTKPVKYEMRPRNTGLFKIMSGMSSTDELRPAMTGVYMDDSGAIATDAHVMLHVAGKKDSKFEDAIYPTDGYMKRRMDEFRESISDLQEKVDLGKAQGEDALAFNKNSLKKIKNAFERYKENPVIDAIYPNWKAILPRSKDDMNTARVHLPFLMSVIKTLKNNVLLNETTYSVELILPTQGGSDFDVTRMGFNAVLLERLVNSFMMLGIDQVDLYYNEPSRAMVMTRAGDVWDWNNPLESLTFGLIMPVMLGGYSGGEYSSVKIVADNVLDVRIGESQTKTLLYSDFYGTKTPTKKPAPKSTSKPIDLDEYTESVFKKMGIEYSDSDWQKRADYTDKYLDLFISNSQKGVPVSETVKHIQSKEGKGDSEKDFLKKKIEAFILMEEFEDDPKEKAFLQDKIKAFEMMQEI